MSRALNVRVPDGLYEKIEAKAASEDRSVSKVVVRALETVLGSGEQQAEDVGPAFVSPEPSIEGRLSEGEPSGRVEPSVGSSPSGDQRGHRATDASEGASPSLSRSGESEKGVIDVLERLPGVRRASAFVVEPFEETA